LASSTSELAVIREKADNIAQVVTTTTQVADQTNMLSTNAAGEAEKPGEHGRGFLVVAREARRLVDQTAVATLNTESRVRLVQGAVPAGVLQTDQFGDEVRSGHLPHRRAARRPQGRGQAPACGGHGGRGHSTGRPGPAVGRGGAGRLLARSDRGAGSLAGPAGPSPGP
jgi:hypothetical protein